MVSINYDVEILRNEKETFEDYLKRCIIELKNNVFIKKCLKINPNMTWKWECKELKNENSKSLTFEIELTDDPMSITRWNKK